MSGEMYGAFAYFSKYNPEKVCSYDKLPYLYNINRNKQQQMKDFKSIVKVNISTDRGDSQARIDGEFIEIKNNRVYLKHVYMGVISISKNTYETRNILKK